MAPENGPTRPIGKIWAFFKDAYEGKLSVFKAEWSALSEKDKDDISNGIVSGTLTY